MVVWSVYPAFHTIAFRDKASTALSIASRQDQPDGNATPSFFLLPSDHEVAGEPPFPIDLSSDEIAELRDERIVVATHYGPASQDKATNQDFALGGVIRLQGQSEYGFIALADGASSRTFWGARTARIACLASFKTVRKLLEGGLDLRRCDAANTLRDAIAPAIRTYLTADAHALEKAKAIPVGWSPDVYQKYKSDRSMWYQSTLLLGVAGDGGCVVGYVGDGGIRTLVVPERTATGPTERCVLRANVGGPLPNSVSLALDATDIRAARFGYDGRTASHVVFASHGLDKTLYAFQRGASQELSRYRDLPLGTRAEAFEFLATISANNASELDNLSVARLSWPIRGIEGRWGAWPQVPVSGWQSAARPAHVVANDPEPQASVEARLFVSYASKDAAKIAHALVDALEASGYRCWIAPRDVIPAKMYSGQIVAAIRESTGVVVLLTPAANESRDVMQEVQQAHDAKKDIAPIIVNQTRPEDNLSYFFGARHQIIWQSPEVTSHDVMRAFPLRRPPPTRPR